MWAKGQVEKAAPERLVGNKAGLTGDPEVAMTDGLGAVSRFHALVRMAAFSTLGSMEHACLLP